MMLLNPWFWLFLVATWLGAAFGGYEWSQGDIKQERAVAQAALEAANKHSKEISDEREATVSKISADLATAQANAAQAAKSLQNNIATGALRLSIAGSCGGKLPNDPTLTGSNNPGQCNIDPGAAQSLVGLTQRGDEAITKLNACIDAYNTLLTPTENPNE
jgi:hypothetical protein